MTGFIQIVIQINLPSGLAELGIFKDYWIFKNSVLYQNTPIDENFVRLNSSFDLEFPESIDPLNFG